MGQTLNGKFHFLFEILNPSLDSVWTPEYDMVGNKAKKLSDEKETCQSKLIACVSIVVFMHYNVETLKNMSHVGNSKPMCSTQLEFVETDFVSFDLSNQFCEDEMI